MRRRVRPVYSMPVQAPISAINTTPIIDIMLVLLIMFIITVPVTTHKVTIDLPLPGKPGPMKPRTVRLDLDSAGNVSWDGTFVAQASLAGLLARESRNPDLEVQISARANTPYEDYDRVLASVKRAGIDRLGLVGNERFAETLDR